MVAVPVGQERVLWDPIRERVHHLDPLAAVLWDALDGETTIDQISDDVSVVWSVDAGVARADVNRFVDGLRERGLLAADDHSP